MRMLDLFCGRWGWSRAFAARGWECVGVDLVEPPEIPEGCHFLPVDVLKLGWLPGDGLVVTTPSGMTVSFGHFDFICASSSCEQFSVHGMKHFHPNPPYPELGIKLFNHTRSLCEASGVPYVMENVRAAQQFVGNAVNHCGPFYLWGTGVPPILPQNITKKQAGMRCLTGAERTRILKAGKDLKAERNRIQRLRERAAWEGDNPGECQSSWSGSAARKAATARAATIPPELAACVADYAMRLMEVPV